MFSPQQHKLMKKNLPQYFSLARFMTTTMMRNFLIYKAYVLSHGSACDVKKKCCMKKIEFKNSCDAFEDIFQINSLLFF